WKSIDSAAEQPGPASCRLSYAILTTDGFWNGPSPALPEPSNVDGTQGAETITNPDGSRSFSYQPAPPFSDTYSNTLADVAMHYWGTDLSNMDNLVPASDADPAFWQHMTTFTMGMGFEPVDSDGNLIPVDALFTWARTNEKPDGITF